MRRQRFDSPRARQRLCLCMIGGVAVLAGLGALIRSTSTPGSTTHSSGYYFDVAAWMLATFAAVFEARTSEIFFGFAERRARRRALFLAIGGLISALLGCYLASAVVDTGTPATVAALANSIMVGGVGAVLAGLFSLGWFYGGNYAAGRVDKMADEDW